MDQHGFPENEIYGCLEKFHDETKEERGKYKTLTEFNEAILNSGKGDPLAKKCKGVVVGNIFLKAAREKKHPLLLALSEMFIIVIPYGPIQSIIHIMAIPQIPMYNIVSVGVDNILLLQKMRAALVKVVTDILIPDSLAQQLYLRALSEGIDSTGISNIKITQEGKLDTSNMKGAQGCEFIRKMLKDYYDTKMKHGIHLDQVVWTDLHVHDTNSVGQLHMHGWITEDEMITDNGKKLKYKNTPLKRIVPLLAKFRGAKMPEKRDIVVKVES